MAQQEWWKRGVIYQIYPRSFNDTTGNGVGDLQGIIDKLDYIADLGVDAIWISPFYPSPMADFGYDVADYTDVDPTFGNLMIFDKLVEEAHARDLKVIVDYVPNHTSNEHPWFKESRSSRDNDRAEWYIWRDAKEDGSLPNNWGSCFGGPAWTWDETRQQYYFHQFDPAQPDLNWRNPRVQAAMLDVLRFWMDRGVDGFRMDVVYMIWKHPEMPDQPLLEGAKLRGEADIFSSQQQIYAFNYEGIHDVIKRIRATLDEQGAVAIGEIWLPLEERMTFYGDGDEFHLPFNFDWIANASFEAHTAWDVKTFRDVVTDYEAAVPEHGWPNYVLGSHDVPRLASRVGSTERAKVAAVMLLTVRGTPTLYMGDEIGMVNGVITEDQIQDPQGLRLGIENSRDVCRTPMQWDASAHAGFSTTAPWLPVNADYKTRNVAAQSNDPGSILTLYKKLLKYRREHLSLSIGDYELLESPAGTFVYMREYEEEQHLIALNFTDDPVDILAPTPGTVVISTSGDRGGEPGDLLLTLEANEALVVKLD